MSADLVARDAEARRRAQTDFERPLVIEAGAGTGKTAALVARILAWCLGPGWERHAKRLAARDASPERVAPEVLRRVVAITFTEAAAAEMAERVARALREVAEDTLPVGVLAEALPPPGEARAERVRALLGALDQLGVRTIHAFCRRLLAEHPLALGLHPRFEVDANGDRQRAAARAVLERALPGLLTDSDALHTLARLGVGPGKIEEALLALLLQGAPPEALAADPLAPERIAALRAELVTALDGFLALERGRLAALTKSARKVAAIAAVLAELRARIGDAAFERAELEQLVAWYHEPGRAVDLGYLRDWARGKLGSTAEKALGQDAGVLAPRAAALHLLLGHLAKLDPARLAAARSVLEPLLASVDAELRRNGVETFPMLLRDARELLARQPEVARRVRAGIDQLLVDEFQDTDRVQCEIVRELVLRAPPRERPGLFVVGDPKQSIYGWRDADLAAYDDFAEEIAAAGGALLSLVVNHRSAPAILAEVERTIAPVMERVRGVQPEFQALVAGRAGEPGFAAEGFAPVEQWVSWDFDATAGEPLETTGARAAELEARALAADLRRLRDAHAVAWREIGLLFRGATDLETYLAALRDAGIPFAVEGDRSYFQRREILEASALVRCVLDPHDQLALVAMLRSAAVGVPDAALLPLWAEKLPDAMARLHGRAADPLQAVRAAAQAAVAALPADVPGLARLAGWAESLVAFARGLALLRASFEADPADVFVEKLRGLVLFEVTEAARYLGAYRVANLERLFRELLEALRDGENDPQAVLRALRRDVAERRESEEARPKEAVEDAVQVLTIHRAKGLDFEHVYLLQLQKGSGGGDESRLEESRDGGFEYELLGARTLGYHRVGERRRRIEDAERVRTLYVALTRARQRLVVAGCRPEHAARGGEDTHVALLERRRGARPALDTEMRACALRGAAHVDDAEGTRWVFPALREGPPEEARERGRHPVFADPGRAAAGARALAVQRAAAAAARERTFHEPVSKRSHEAAAAHWREGPSSDEGAEEGAGAPRAAAPLPRDVASAVGTALHRALERLDPLAGDAGAERARLHAGLEDDLVRALPDEQRTAALARAGALLDRFLAGPLGARLRALAPHVVARELPVLLPPDPADPVGPTGFLAGAIDLVYVDPDTQEWVIADYKTDAVTGEGELAARARDYALQGAGYVRALREALELEQTPRFELWFLDAERVLQAPGD